MAKKSGPKNLSWSQWSGDQMKLLFDWCVLQCNYLLFGWMAKKIDFVRQLSNPHSPPIVCGFKKWAVRQKWEAVSFEGRKFFREMRISRNWTKTTARSNYTKLSVSINSSSALSKEKKEDINHWYFPLPLLTLTRRTSAIRVGTKNIEAKISTIYSYRNLKHCILCV